MGVFIRDAVSSEEFTGMSVAEVGPGCGDFLGWVALCGGRVGDTLAA
jgi:hypothetical protein